MAYGLFSLLMDLACRVAVGTHSSEPVEDQMERSPMISSVTLGRRMAIAIALAALPLSGAAAATSPGDVEAAAVVRGDGVRPLERLAQKQTDPEQPRPGTPGGAPGGAPGMRPAPAPEAGGPSDAARRGVTPYRKEEPEPKGQSDKKKSERERTDK